MCFVVGKIPEVSTCKVLLHANTNVSLVKLCRQEGDMMQVARIVHMFLQLLQNQFGQLHVFVYDAEGTAGKQTLNRWLW